MYQRADTGMWVAAMTVNTPTGRRRRWVTAQRRRGVHEKLTIAIREAQQGLSRADTRLTIAHS